MNHKKVYRIYVEERLQVRRRRRKRIARTERRRLLAVNAVNLRWSMDFQHDVTAKAQRFRTLNIVDDFSRECPVIEVDTSLTGERVGSSDRVLLHRLHGFVQCLCEGKR